MDRFIDTHLTGVYSYKNIDYVTVENYGYGIGNKYRCNLCNTREMGQSQMREHVRSRRHEACYHELEQSQKQRGEKQELELEKAKKCDAILKRIEDSQLLLFNCPTNFPSAATSLKVFSYDYIVHSKPWTDGLKVLAKYQRREKLALLELGVVKFLVTRSFPEGIDEARVQRSIDPSFRFRSFLRDLRTGDAYVIVSSVARFVGYS